MNLLKRGTLLIALLGVAGAAQAQLSSTITATTDYDFRGISLSGPNDDFWDLDAFALQASVDYAFENGFAVGAWASNIDYGNTIDGDIELDLYASFSREINEKTSWNLGIVWYTYPGSEETESKSEIADYGEVSAGITFDALSFKQWYSWDYSGTDNDAWYTEAAYTFELPQNFSFGVHLGYNYGDAFDREYLDYSASFGYAISNFNLVLKFVGTDADPEVKGDDENPFTNTNRVLFYVNTTLPWGE